MACAPELCRGLLDGHSLQEAALSPPDIPVRGSIGPEQPTRKLMCQEPQPSGPTQLPQVAQPAHEAAASEEPLTDDAECLLLEQLLAERRAERAQLEQHLAGLDADIGVLARSRYTPSVKLVDEIAGALKESEARRVDVVDRVSEARFQLEAFSTDTEQAFEEINAAADMMCTRCGGSIYKAAALVACCAVAREAKLRAANICWQHKGLNALVARERCDVKLAGVNAEIERQVSFLQQYRYRASAALSALVMGRRANLPTSRPLSRAKQAPTPAHTEPSGTISAWRPNCPSGVVTCAVLLLGTGTLLTRALKGRR